MRSVANKSQKNKITNYQVFFFACLANNEPLSIHKIQCNLFLSKPIIPNYLANLDEREKSFNADIQW